MQLLQLGLSGVNVTRRCQQEDSDSELSESLPVKRESHGVGTPSTLRIFGFRYYKIGGFVHYFGRDKSAL